jgi:hypothetical protein
MEATMLDSSYGKTTVGDLDRGNLSQWWMFRADSGGDTNDTFVEVTVHYDPRGPMNCDAKAAVYNYDTGEEIGLFALTEPPSNWWSEVNAKLVAATGSAPSRLLTVADSLSNRMAALLSRVFEEEDAWVRTDSDGGGDEKQNVPG